MIEVVNRNEDTDVYATRDKQTVLVQLILQAKGMFSEGSSDLISVSVNLSSCILLVTKRKWHN